MRAWDRKLVVFGALLGSSVFVSWIGCRAPDAGTGTTVDEAPVTPKKKKAPPPPEDSVDTTDSANAPDDLRPIPPIGGGPVDTSATKKPAPPPFVKTPLPPSHPHPKTSPSASTWTIPWPSTLPTITWGTPPAPSTTATSPTGTPGIPPTAPPAPTTAPPQTTPSTTPTWTLPPFPTPAPTSSAPSPTTPGI